MLVYTFWEWWFIWLWDSTEDESFGCDSCGEEDSLDETFGKVSVAVSLVVKYGVCSDVFIYVCCKF